jgi:hypothetical protein
MYYAFQETEIINIATIFTTGNIFLFLFTLYFYFRHSTAGWILMMGILSYDLTYSILPAGYSLQYANDTSLNFLNSEPISYFWLTLPILIYIVLILILFSKALWQPFKVSTVQLVLSFCTGFLFFPGILSFMFYFMGYFD